MTGHQFSLTAEENGDGGSKDFTIMEKNNDKRTFHWCIQQTMVSETKYGGTSSTSLQLLTLMTKTTRNIS